MFTLLARPPKRVCSRPVLLATNGDEPRSSALLCAIQLMHLWHSCACEGCGLVSALSDRAETAKLIVPVFNGVDIGHLLSFALDLIDILKWK